MSLAKPKPFNIVPPPSESKVNDDVLRRAYKDLIYFGRAFLPKDFLNKSASPKFHYEVAEKLISTKPGAGYVIYFLGVLASLSFQKQQYFIKCVSLHRVQDYS